ncbi:MAG: phosphopantothenoylcysteine decarboxylase, partial [Alistipes sp.]|nr:phosphopantothenoylcysteine decarboxylase [Alistipes sp.]
ARGAEVQLISGRTVLDTPVGVERIDVLSAEDMYREATQRFEDADIAVMCAAVADYTPKEVADHKIKKGEGDMQLTLRRTHDIAAALGAVKGNRILVGFALESDDGIESAKRKLTTKSFDFVVLNSMKDKGATFGTDTNLVTFVDSEGCNRLPLLSKREVAEQIADRIEAISAAKE